MRIARGYEIGSTSILQSIACILLKPPRLSDLSDLISSVTFSLVFRLNAKVCWLTNCLVHVFRWIKFIIHKYPYSLGQWCVNHLPCSRLMKELQTIRKTPTNIVDIIRGIHWILPSMESKYCAKQPWIMGSSNKIMPVLFKTMLVSVCMRLDR